MPFDLHNDFPTVLPACEYGAYLASVSATVTSAIWTSEFRDTEATARVEKITEELSKYNVPIAVEDLHFLNEQNIEKFDFGRYFYCSLTWNHDNTLAGGQLGKSGLTRFGKLVISAINGACALDLSHLNRKSFFSALERAAHPMCSHTAFGKDPRCLDDEMIRALIRADGIIGLFGVVKYTGAKTSRALAEIADKFVCRYGIDSLCIGTDFYGSDDFPSDFKDYSDLDGFSSELSRLGYEKTDIEKIFTCNASRFYTLIESEKRERRA